MAIHRKTSILHFLHALFLFTISTSHQFASGDDNQLKTYIIHVQHPEGVQFPLVEDREKWHHSILSAAIAGQAAPRLIYSYGNAFNGFSARLTSDEVKVISGMDWFMDAYEGGRYSLRTTRTPEFLGLHPGQGIWNFTNMGEGIIIGIIDSGIFPEHYSFNDNGMPPPPAKWKGRCEFTNASLCNNKLIGARSFLHATLSGLDISTAEPQPPPIDDQGHGTHVASIAAGGFVKHITSPLGTNAESLAAGMAPRAHLAIYRISMAAGDSFEGGVDNSPDVLAAVDAAVADGVDVINFSGGMIPSNFYNDPFAVAAFGAVSKGVFVSCAAGNDGPQVGTVSNLAPWLLTVGASSIDRKLRATVKLGNGLELDGESAYQPEDFGSEMLPLVYASACQEDTLDEAAVRGKIVLCPVSGLLEESAGYVQKAGGVAMILMNFESYYNATLAIPHVLPASYVGYSDGEKIKAYINSTSNPTASIVFKGTVTGIPGSPAVTAFSSRGPNVLTTGILKPDITGPGASILGAWPSDVPIGSPLPTGQAGQSLFNVKYGTSQSTPHLSGIAALIKSAHPDWSPAAIKSAIMTTADVLDRSGKPIVDERNLPASHFALGAGHVNPSRAMDPGLVYDITTDEYIAYLCGLGGKYNDTRVGKIAHRPVKCSSVKKIAEGELNYPSISVKFDSDPQTVTLERTVTNVGESVSTYWAEVEAPAGVSVQVEPKRLVFSKLNQKITFKMIFGRNGGGAAGTAAHGRLKWVSPRRVVQSPVSIFFGEFEFPSMMPPPGMMSPDLGMMPPPGMMPPDLGMMPPPST